jgi:hypothetical protein
LSSRINTATILVRVFSICLRAFVNINAWKVLISITSSYKLRIALYSIMEVKTSHLLVLMCTFRGHLQENPNNDLFKKTCHRETHGEDTKKETEGEKLT